MPVNNIVGGPGAIGGASGGKFLSFNFVGIVASIILGQNPARRRVTFHNPGTRDLYVGPLFVLNHDTGLQETNTFSLSGLGGSFLVVANGGTLTFDGGEIQGAWQALATSGADNPLTVMDSNIG